MSAAIKKHSTVYYVLAGLFFILMLLAFDRGFFHLLSSIEKKAYRDKDLQQIFFQKRDFNKQFLSLPKGTYNTLILGSSRTHRGIHPYYINKRLGQKAFKIAKAKIRMKFNYYFYEEYKKIAGVPRVVICGMDYFMFKLKSHPYFMKQLLGDGDLDSGSDYVNGPLLLVSNKKKVDSFLNTTLEKWNTAFAAPTGNLKFNVVDPFIGYRKQETLDTRSPARFKKFKYEGYPGVEGVYFKKLLDQWQQDQVQVVLVYLPDFIGTHKSNYQLKQFKEEVKRLTSPYKNIRIYDYNRPGKFALDNPAYFLDGGYGKTNSHLSLTGSRVFHRKFVKDLKNTIKTKM